MSTIPNESTDPAVTQPESQQQQQQQSQPPASQQLTSQQAAAAPIQDATPPLPESKMPTRKDTSLKEFLTKMDDYAPIVRVASNPLSIPVSRDPTKPT